MNPIEWCKKRIAEEKAKQNWLSVMHYEELLEMWTKKIVE